MRGCGCGGGSSGGVGTFGARLGGAFPCMNAGFAMKQVPVSLEHFIVGDFIVVDTRGEGRGQPPFCRTGQPRGEQQLPAAASGAAVKAEAGATEGSATEGGRGGAAGATVPRVRFDERFILKEDYDFTSQVYQRIGLTTVRELGPVDYSGSTATVGAFRSNGGGSDHTQPGVAGRPALHRVSRTQTAHEVEHPLPLSSLPFRFAHLNAFGFTPLPSLPSPLLIASTWRRSAQRCG